jgi:hypothetical protein
MRGTRNRYKTLIGKFQPPVVLHRSRSLSLSLSLSLSMALQPFGPWRFFSFLVLYTVGRTPWTGVQLVARQLPTHRMTQTQNKRTQTSMPHVGFDHTTPVFE